MLARYQMKRGARKADLPDGIRMDTRKHTKHVLRPPAAVVTAYLVAPTAAAWAKFRSAYRAELASRFADNRAAFDELAERARHEDVYLGCSCPTATNPDVRHCHTWLALEFMHKQYPDLKIVFPKLSAATMAQ